MAFKRSGDEELHQNEKKLNRVDVSEDAVVHVTLMPKLPLSSLEDIVALVTSPEEHLARDGNTMKAWVLRGLMGASYHGANVRISEVILFFLLPLIGFVLICIVITKNKKI